MEGFFFSSQFPVSSSQFPVSSWQVASSQLAMDEYLTCSNSYSLLTLGLEIVCSWSVASLQ